MIDLKYRIEWQIDKRSNFPLYLYMVAGGSDCCNHDVSGFSFIVKFNAVSVVQIIRKVLHLLGRDCFNGQVGNRLCK